MGAAAAAAATTDAPTAADDVATIAIYFVLCKSLKTRYKNVFSKINSKALRRISLPVMRYVRSLFHSGALSFYYCLAVASKCHNVHRLRPFS